MHRFTLVYIYILSASRHPAAPDSGLSPLYIAGEALAIFFRTLSGSLHRGDFCYILDDFGVYFCIFSLFLIIWGQFGGHFGVWGQPRAPEENPRAPKRPQGRFPGIGEPELLLHFGTILGSFSLPLGYFFRLFFETPFWTHSGSILKPRASKKEAFFTWPTCCLYG